MSLAYRTSTFTHKMEDCEGNIILYNSLSGTIIRFDSKHNNALNEILFKNKYDDSEICEKLIVAKILIPSDFNEFEYINKLRNDMVNNNETLDILIYPTEACNLRCKYCWENFKKNNMERKTEESVIAFLEKHVPKYKRLYIKWFGGEPLLNVAAIERIMKVSIKICRSNSVILSSSITTNGYLLTNDIVRRLIKHKIYEYQVTVDGLKEDHDKMRVMPNGEGSFDVIVKNLLTVKKEVANKLLRILIRTNFNENNIVRIHEYAKLYLELFGDDNRFSAYWNAVQDWGGNAVRNVEDILINNYDKTMINIVAEQYNIPMIIENSLLNPGGYACYAGKRNSYIFGSDGLVYKCPQKIYDEYNKIGHLDIDGDLILDKDKYEEWVLPTLEEKCNTCILRPSCLSARCPKRKFTKQECQLQIEQLERMILTFANHKYNYIEFK